MPEALEGLNATKQRNLIKLLDQMRNQAKPRKNTMPEPKALPADLQEYRDSYVRLFGTLPPLPRARFDFTGTIDPEDLRLAEAYREHAYHNTVFDDKTTQLIAFAVLLAANSPGAKWHAVSARRAGATWEELQTAASITAVASALGPANLAGGLLDELYRAETTSEEKS